MLFSATAGPYSNKKEKPNPGILHRQRPHDLLERAHLGLTPPPYDKLEAREEFSEGTSGQIPHWAVPQIRGPKTLHL